MNPSISVIIPVYNSGKYLSNCLESVLSQSFVDWELILINDGSKDDSGKICDKYSQIDPRIKVIHQKNQGVSSARNRGLEIAKGDWIYFCDSDDELLIDNFRSLFSAIEDNIDMVIGGFTEINGFNENNRCSRGRKRSLNIGETIKELFEPKDKIYKGYLWTKLFKRDVIAFNKLRFDTDIIYNEDRLFIAQYLSKVSGQVNYIPKNIYKYFKRNTGAMANMKSDAFETDLDAFLKMIDIIDNLKQTELSKIVRKWAVLSWFINYRIKDKEDLKTKRKRLNDKIHSKVNMKEFLYGVLFSLTLMAKSKLSKWKNMIIS